MRYMVRVEGAGLPPQDTGPWAERRARKMCDKFNAAFGFRAELIPVPARFAVREDGTLSCGCGNTPAGSGFDPCGPNGVVDPSLLDADSDRPTYWLCGGCGVVGVPEEAGRR